MVAAQAHGVLARTGLTDEQAEHAAWAVDEDVCVGGARAVAVMFAVSWKSTLPLLPWRIPGVPWLLDRCYELVARNRYRLPGDTPWCVAHDGDCVPRRA